MFTSDNGGPTTTGDGVGARNWPLRGGKHSVWEGGTRATAVIAGAGMGAALAGTQFTHLMHGADWLPTLAEAAGIAKADVGGALPLDGVSHWAALSGAPGAARRPQRTNVTLGNSTNECSWQALGDPRRVRYEAHGAVNVGSEAEILRAQKLGCGFAIRADDLEVGRSWKLIRGFGGGPDTWCNTSKAAGGNVCDNHLVPPPTAAATAVATAASSLSALRLACSSTAGLCFPKNDLSHFHSNRTDGADCCAACIADAKCGGWTHNKDTGKGRGPTCYLKTTLAGIAPDASPDCISGTNGATPMPVGPTPAPTPPTPPTPPGLNSCPNGYCLYDVAEDPHERTELSALRGDIVAAMITRMEDVLRSYDQYEEDKSCPPVTYANDSVVGKSWQPWC